MFYSHVVYFKTHRQYVGGSSNGTLCNELQEFYILVTVHLGIIPINNKLDAQFLLYIFISFLYMFRATLCSSSGESIESIQHRVYVTLCRRSGIQVGKVPNCITNGQLHRVTYTRCCIGTTDSPDDEHRVARNM
jgi:hypothetical protein